MARKKKSIKLRWANGVGGGKDCYIVVTISDSVDYHPGQSISEAEVKGLCDKDYWSVHIVGE